MAAPFWGESTGHRWIPLTKHSDADLWCIHCSAPTRVNGWANNRDTSHLGRHHAHYDAIQMFKYMMYGNQVDTPFKLPDIFVKIEINIAVYTMKWLVAYHQGNWFYFLSVLIILRGWTISDMKMKLLYIASQH